MIATALLLLGACGSASRTMTVEPSIEQIVVRVVVGGVKDVCSEGLPVRTLRGVSSRTSEVTRTAIQSVSLRLDGRERTGVFAWVSAINRVAGYAVSRSEDREQASKVHGGSGSVEYPYRLRVVGFDIRRSTRISDGRVSLVTDVYGRIGPRGELHHVRLSINATEFRHGDGSPESAVSTRITGTATGWSEIGRRCRVVAAIASRQIRLALDRELLGRIQRGGIDLYRAGSIAEALR